MVLQPILGHSELEGVAPHDRPFSNIYWKQSFLQLLLLFCPSWSCTIICCINLFTSLCKKLVRLTWVFSRSFSMPTFCHPPYSIRWSNEITKFPMLRIPSFVIFIPLDPEHDLIFKGNVQHRKWSYTKIYSCSSKKKRRKKKKN